MSDNNNQPSSQITSTKGSAQRHSKRHGAIPAPASPELPDDNAEPSDAERRSDSGERKAVRVVASRCHSLCTRYGLSVMHSMILTGAVDIKIPVKVRPESSNGIHSRQSALQHLQRKQKDRIMTISDGIILS